DVDGVAARDVEDVGSDRDLRRDRRHRGQRRHAPEVVPPDDPLAVDEVAVLELLHLVPAHDQVVANPDRVEAELLDPVCELLEIRVAEVLRKLDAKIHSSTLRYNRSTLGADTGMSDSLRGRVATLRGYGQPIELEEYVVPEPEPGGMILEIEQAAICGSDLHV